MKQYNILIFALVCFTGVVRAEVDSLTVITSWKLTDNFSRSVPHDVDTNLPNFQIYHQAYQMSKSLTFLGNVGSPVLSNIYTERNRDDYPFFLKPYLPYFHTLENTYYYNTKKPFSRLSYSYGPGISNKEQTFEAFHTQNTSANFNFSLRYHNISSRGQYPSLHVKKNVFRISSSYTGDKYLMHSAFNFNRYNAGESGGLADRTFENLDSYQFPIDLASRIGSDNSRLSLATKTIRYYNLLVSQRLKLFTLETDADTSAVQKGRTVAEPVLTHVFTMDRASMFYEDKTGVGSGIYDYYYFNTNKSVDSTSNYRLRNTLQLEFKTTFRGKIQTGIYGQVGHEFERYKFKSEWDTNYIFTPNDTIFTPYVHAAGDTLKGTIDPHDESSVFISTGLYGNFWGRIKSNFSGTVYLAGYKSGQTELKGVLNNKFNVFGEVFNLNIEGIIENKKPNYLLQKFYSNNFIWENTLLPEKGIRLSSVIGRPSKNFEIRGNYHLLRKHIYFNELAKPDNYGENLNYFSVEASKTFSLWKIRSINKAVYQIADNQNILPLPDLVLYNSSYIDHTFRFKKTNGSFQVILGLDIFYNTEFNAYDYAPALSQFYVQDPNTGNIEKIGNYPIVDAYLNIKLKKVRFFAKSEHFNSYLMEQRFYSALRYPFNQWTYKFGLSWVFYD